MNHRFPLVATVVGALVIGGATTGTTLALWRDQAAPSGSVESGNLVLHVDGDTTATFTGVGSLGLNNGATPGAPQSFSATLKNAGTGKNLRMQVYLDSFTTSSEFAAGLEVAVSTVPTGDACPTPVTTDYKPLSTWTATALTSSSMAAAATRKLCGSVRVRGGATNIAGKSGPLTFNFRGQQVRTS